MGGVGVSAILLYFFVDTEVTKIRYYIAETLSIVNLWRPELLPDFSTIVSFISALATSAAAIYTAKAAKAAEVSSMQWRQQAVYDKYLDKAIKSRASLIQIQSQLAKIEEGPDSYIDEETINQDEGSIDQNSLVWIKMMGEDLYLTLSKHILNATEELHYTYTLSYEYIKKTDDTTDANKIESAIGNLNQALNMYYEISEKIFDSTLEDEDSDALIEGYSDKFLLNEKIHMLFFTNMIFSIELMKNYLTYTIIHPNEKMWNTSTQLFTKNVVQLNSNYSS